MAHAEQTSHPSAARHRGAADWSTAKAYLVGGGIGSLAAAFMIRDGKKTSEKLPKTWE